MLSSHHEMSVFGQVTMLSNHQQNVGVRSLCCLSRCSAVTTRFWCLVTVLLVSILSSDTLQSPKCWCLVRSRCSPVTTRCRCLVRSRCSPITGRMSVLGQVTMLSSHHEMSVLGQVTMLSNHRENVGVRSLCCLSYVTHQSPVDIDLWSLCCLSRYCPVTRCRLTPNVSPMRSTQRQ